MKLNSYKVVLRIVVLLVFIAGPNADAQENAFDRSSVRLSFVGGWGQAFNDDYFILGGGAGYFISDGLEVGTDFEAWVGGSPNIYKLRPVVRYVLNTAPNLKPYISGFYSHTFIENLDDLDSTGLSGGLYYRAGGGAYFGVGLAYEKFIDCKAKIYSDCSDFYPEFTVSFPL
jgi:hypothetical protein